MCSPKLSFLINKAKKIFYKDGMQNHSDLAEHFDLEEDNLINVDYDWVAKTIDIYGPQNMEGNKVCPFKATDKHYEVIDSFIEKKIGTRKKLVKWLKKNYKDIKIKKESLNLLSDDGQSEYFKIIRKKKYDLDTLLQVFNNYPNKVWRMSI